MLAPVILPKLDYPSKLSLLTIRGMAYRMSSRCNVVQRMAQSCCVVRTKTLIALRTQVTAHSTKLALGMCTAGSRLVFSFLSKKRLARNCRGMLPTSVVWTQGDCESGILARNAFANPQNTIHFSSASCQVGQRH